MIFSKLHIRVLTIVLGGLFFFVSAKRLYSQSFDKINAMFYPQSNPLIIPDINDIYGVCITDLNQDDQVDIYLVGFRSLNRLLLNQGPDVPFEDATIASGLGGDLMARGTENLELCAAAFDLENDGDKDLLIAGWDNTTSLLRSDGSFPFSNIVDPAGLPTASDINDVEIADVNLDGYLDVFLTDEHDVNHLLINQKNGFFKDKTLEYRLVDEGISQDASFCDVDLDGDMDLYVCNWSGPDFFYRNIEGRFFQRVLLNIATCQEYISTNSSTFSDFDNDGDFDLFVAYHRGMNFLYMNQTLPKDTNWVFTDEAIERHLSDAALTYGGVVADINHDTWLDIFVTNTGSNQLYMGTGQGYFEKVYEDTMMRPVYSTGASFGDIDSDGDLDLLVANKDTFCVLYKNPINNTHYLKITIHGVFSNRDGIGTRINCYISGKLNQEPFLVGSRIVGCGNGYLSQNESIAHFGLDSLKQVDLKIIFPSGKMIVKRQVSSGQFLHVYEQPWLVRSFIQGWRIVLMQIQQLEFWIGFFLFLIFFIQIIVLIRLGLKRYEWSTTTTVLYLTGYFLFAFLSLILLKPLGTLTQFSIIDGLSLFFTAILFIYFERMSKWRKIRKKYESILIQLSHQIASIHEDDALLKMVIQNIQTNTEFKSCCIVLYDEKKKRCVKINCPQQSVSIQTLNKESFLPDFVQKLKKDHYCQYHRTETFAKIFTSLQVKHIIAIQHENRFFGWLGLGELEQIIPFTIEDIELFQSLTSQMAITLDNIYYINQSNEMIKKLTKAEVREKYLKELEDKNHVLDVKNKELQKLYEELKQTQSQLIHSEKMASLGQLVAGISHELNNPVAFIYSNIKQLKKYTHKIEEKLDASFSSDTGLLVDDIQALIEDTIQGSQMVKSLVDNLRRFSHLDGAAKKKVNIHEGIDSSLLILRPQLKNRIEVKKEYLSDGMIECNPGQLNQVFMNIISNAAHAISDTGHIQIHTEDVNGEIVIQIQDDGQGISEDVLNHIFEPFYTTKDVGKGTGLGLSISYSIIENHQGKITVISQQGKGSRFTITIPKEMDNQ